MMAKAVCDCSVFRVLRFTRANQWGPETVGESDDYGRAQGQAHHELGRQGGVDAACAVAIVDDSPRGEKLVLYRTCGFVPLDIEERIWQAVHGGTSGQKPGWSPLDTADLHTPAETEKRKRCVQLDTVACELEQQAADDRAHGGALAMAASLVRQHLAVHGHRAAAAGDEREAPDVHA
jgi:hypothetical protein